MSVFGAAGLYGTQLLEAMWLGTGSIGSLGQEGLNTGGEYRLCTELALGSSLNQPPGTLLYRATKTS